MNQYPSGSQGAHGKLSTGRWGSLGVAGVDRKKIVWASITYGVFLVHPAVGRLVRWLLDGRRYGVGQVGQRM